jgi:hypothetical protein
MGALSPLFLLAALSIGVPIYLHLFQRQQTRRLSFPALRYLERTEREHARQIRFRQFLLLMLRVLALLLITGAGARLFFAGRGSAHAPTAAVIVLDNSLSSGLVVGEVRLLDELKGLASSTLDAASDEDRFWLIRAGEPWLPAIPGTAADTRQAVEETEVSEAGGDLSAALERAVRLLDTSTMEHREIHLLSDLQSTSFVASEGAPTGDVPVIVWTGHEPRTTNRALTSVVVGGGLPPLEGQRASVTIEALESTSESDTLHVPLRLVVNERIRGAATLPPGAQTTIALPPSGRGWVQGYADADPDDLRADDRRFFAYRSRPAPAVTASGDGGVFSTEALAVLEEAGRVRVTGMSDADVLVSANGAGLDRSAGAALILPPSDPILLPALNRRLADAGVPWRLEPTVNAGEAFLEGRALPDPLEDVRVFAWFDMVLAGDPPAPPRVLAEVDGRPWAIEGLDRNGRRYLLLASPLDARATSLPVSTAMLRFIDWAIGEWAGAGGAPAEYVTGATVPAPSAATHVRFPSGRDVEIDGTRMVRGTGEAGFYTFLADDSIVSVLALNPPRHESLLTPIDAADLEQVIGGEIIDVDREGVWDRAVYRARQGPELWWPFLLAMMLLLLGEATMATSGTVNPLSGRGATEGASDGGD